MLIITFQKTYMNKIGNILEVNSCLIFTIVYLFITLSILVLFLFHTSTILKQSVLELVGLHFNLSLWQQTLCIRQYELYIKSEFRFYKICRFFPN